MNEGVWGSNLLTSHEAMKTNILHFFGSPHTVRKFDEVVRHQHLVTQDQFTLVSKKDSGIPKDNFNKNIEVFRQTFTNVELLRYKHIPNVELFR
jgi:hypothetical protein